MPLDLKEASTAWRERGLDSEISGLLGLSAGLVALRVAAVVTGFVLLG
jgi:hypothetical protein